MADLADFGRQLAQFRQSLSVLEQAKINKALATAAVGDADEAAARSLGADRGFTGGKGRGSGWRTKAGQVIPLAVQVVQQGTIDAAIVPSPRRTGGLWTVTEGGRQSAVLGPYITPKVSKAGKVAKTRRLSKAKRGRYNGSTVGKGTATTAHRLMADRTPKRLEAEWTPRFVKIFRG